MASLALDTDKVVARLADEAGPLTLILDQVVLMSEEPMRGLSKRERQILLLLAEGMSNEEIGKQLFISPATARTHVRAMMVKLGAENRVTAVALAQALRMGRKGQALSPEEIRKGRADFARLQKVLAKVPEDGHEMIVLIADVARDFLMDPAWQGHPVVAEIGAEVLKLTALITADPELDDPNWEIREQVAHIEDLLETLKREIEHSAIDDPRRAVGFVLDELASVDQKELATLLGYASDRSLRDWRAEKTKEFRGNPDRVTLIGQLVYDLRTAMSPHGILAWFNRPRHQLGGKAPVDLINQNPKVADEPLRALARGFRGQLAT